MAVEVQNAKERLLRQDLQDKPDFLKIFCSIKFIQLILSNKRLNGAKLFLWTTLQNTSTFTTMPAEFNTPATNWLGGY